MKFSVNKFLSFLWLFILSATVSAISSCSSVKHVPDGQYLLDNVTIDITADSTGQRPVHAVELYNFLRQQPNHKVLGFAKLQLATYSLSGRDSTKWINRWLQRLGQPPVIYSDELTELSRRQLLQAMINRGYIDASVTVDTVAHPQKKRMDVRYAISPGRARTISQMTYDGDDEQVLGMIVADSANTLIVDGMLLDRNILDAERGRITNMLRNKGYYGFNREDITYIADTIAGNSQVALTMTVHKPRNTPAKPATDMHLPAVIRNVYIYTDGADGSTTLPADTVIYKGIHVVYGPDHYLRPQILEEKCMIDPDMPYSAAAIDRTYQNLAQLSILKFINIEMEPVAVVDGKQWLDCIITLSRNKKQSISVEVEGTNSEGDLGMGLGLTYQHRNLAHGSQMLTAKVRGSYESLSGDFEGLINNRYTELAAEAGITFPKFEAPFLSRNFKRNMRASTEFSISTNYQERPEYTRIIAGGTWKYKWSKNRRNGGTIANTWDFIDINYVYLPHSTLNFIDEIAPTNPLLRYSYEDHFIMRMGYSFYTSNRRAPETTSHAFASQPSISTTRASIETAGNVLYAISSLTGQKRSDNAYKIFGIQYAQYIKGDVDFSHVINLNGRNALAFHTAFGIGYPYGNSSMIPFEKRFYAGGANSVRGWSVRTLGPGCYQTRNNVLNFINQCGDISLLLNVEYRLKLFWVFEGAVFVDAGNIWTIRNYETQPGGWFRFNNFYKQIAAGYGVGLRMDFTYFLLRLDLGMKAHNPATGEEKWPIAHPRWGRDHALHFAVGYPF